jgi:hypothetical protein
VLDVEVGRNMHTAQELVRMGVKQRTREKHRYNPIDLLTGFEVTPLAHELEEQSSPNTIT